MADTKISKILGGRASTFIVHEAENWPADLIVMGTRGIRGLCRMVMGSDVEHVVRTVVCP